MKVKLVGLAVVIAIFTAPTASADQYDYLSYVDSQGVPYPSISLMIDLGKAVCFALRKQIPLDSIGSELMGTANYSAAESAVIVSGAAHFMCPDTIPYLTSEVNRFQGGQVA